jgi:hypothetical protein
MGLWNRLSCDFVLGDSARRTVSARRRARHRCGRRHLRDDAIVAPLAALLAAAVAWRRDHRALQILVVEALAVLMVFGGLEAWRRQMEHGDAPSWQ